MFTSSYLPAETQEFLTQFALLGGQKDCPEFIVNIESEKITLKGFLASRSRPHYQAWYWIKKEFSQQEKVIKAFTGIFAQMVFNRRETEAITIGFDYLEDKAPIEHIADVKDVFSVLISDPKMTVDKERRYIVLNWLEFCISYKEGDSRSCALFAYDIVHDLCDLAGRSAGYGNIIDTDMEKRAKINGILRDVFQFEIDNPNY